MSLLKRLASKVKNTVQAATEKFAKKPEQRSLENICSSHPYRTPGTTTPYTGNQPVVNYDATAQQIFGQFMYAETEYRSGSFLERKTAGIRLKNHFKNQMQKYDLSLAEQKVIWKKVCETYSRQADFAYKQARQRKEDAKTKDALLYPYCGTHKPRKVSSLSELIVSKDYLEKQRAEEIFRTAQKIAEQYINRTEIVIPNKGILGLFSGPKQSLRFSDYLSANISNRNLNEQDSRFIREIALDLITTTADARDVSYFAKQKREALRAQGYANNAAAYDRANPQKAAELQEYISSLPPQTRPAPQLNQDAFNSVYGYEPACPTVLKTTPKDQTISDRLFH